MQSTMKELRSLKQEEMAMINMASKISDQLNRLKVEELALQNLVRIENEEQDQQQGDRDQLRDNSRPRDGDDRATDKDFMEYEEQAVVPLDLVVNRHNKQHDWRMEEEEEEEEEEEVKEEQENENMDDNGVHDDIEQFVKLLY